RPTPELYARWLEAAVFTPFLRSHSVGWAGNKEPWEYGDDFTVINRATIELRYKFLPYIYTLFREHEQTGMPVMRPLWFEYPADKKTYLIADEYLVGSDLLVAPVVKEGLSEREVYFPAGENWVDWWTGEIYDGGKSYTIKAPIERLPLFVRVGAVIATQPAIQNTGEMSSVPITLFIGAGIAAGKTETSTLFQDAGDGYGYQQSDWREFKFEHRQGSLKISHVGNFPGQPIRALEVMGLNAAPRELRVDGQPLKFSFDPPTRRLHTDLPERASEITIIR
ncbi:MAG TPA: TIM-barrel domain-containing protein, partial [Pyrinomonadaceae bacterium]|nr:TIM-barrel domain-containing protein [Pyrinomonadaceae bacterium]